MTCAAFDETEGRPRIGVPSPGLPEVHCYFTVTVRATKTSPDGVPVT
jgi:hypothetical protein